jgi:hypothetical protein
LTNGATICTRETVVSTAAIFAFERTLSGLNEQFNIEVPSALDSLMIGNRKVIDVLNSIAFAIGHNIRVDRPILRTEIARVMEENGLPYKPNEVIGICEFCERHLGKGPAMRALGYLESGNAELAIESLRKVQSVCDMAMMCEYTESEVKPNEHLARTFKSENL